MILASHGIIGSSIVQFNANVPAQEFYDRVTAAGGSLTSTEEDAILNLIIDLNNAGIWTKMKAIYPMVGASAAACAQNLKSSSFTGTFTAGWTFASSGVTGNGSSTYMDPSLTSAANLSLNSAHIAYYSRTDSGASMVMAGTRSLYVLGRWTNFHANNSEESATGINTGLTSAGFFMSNRIIGTEMKFQINGTIQTDSMSTAATASIQATQSLYMGCQNTDRFGVRLYNNFSTAWYSLGDGLSDTEAVNFYNAVQTFQTTLNREIAP
jgi:hypothetical protein